MPDVFITGQRPKLRAGTAEPATAWRIPAHRRLVSQRSEHPFAMFRRRRPEGRVGQMFGIEVNLGIVHAAKLCHCAGNRQTDAVYFALQHGSINNRENHDLAGGVSDETARKELAALVQAELLFKDGAGRLARYVLEPTLQTVEDDDPFRL